MLSYVFINKQMPLVILYIFNLPLRHHKRNFCIDNKSEHPMKRSQ